VRVPCILETEEMDRARLNKRSMVELQQEASMYGIPVGEDKAQMIDAIMKHFETHGPVAEFTRGRKEVTGLQEKGRAQSDPNIRPGHTSQEMDSQQINQTLTGLTNGILAVQREMADQQRRFLEQQHQQWQQLVQLLAANRAEPPPPQSLPSGGSSPQSQGRQNFEATGPRTPPATVSFNGATNGGTIKWLATQISDFGGEAEENVLQWTRRVDRVAQIHGASDGATLLAASSRLTKSAKKWYGLQDGTVLESWCALKEELIKIFDRQVPYYVTMRKVEARKWLSAKETFDQYAIEKMALTQTLNLSVKDKVHLLCGGITQFSLKATALSLPVTTIQDFLAAMRHIAEGVSYMEKKSPDAQSASAVRPTGAVATCRNCGKPGHTHRECANEVTCFYCKGKGHRYYECQQLKRKEEGTNGRTTRVAAAATTAAVTEEAAMDETEEDLTIATVEDHQGGTAKLCLSSPLVRVSSFMRNPCKLVVLIDTGSPASFIKNRAFVNFAERLNVDIAPSQRSLRNLSREILNVSGKFRAIITLEPLANLTFPVDLHVLENTSFDADIILGRDFLAQSELTLVYRPSADKEKETINLFAVLLLCVEDGSRSHDLEQILEEIVIDFDDVSRQRLRDLLREIQNKDVPPIVDNHAVRVQLKDNSVYAYAPRRFAHIERLELRDITDELLRQGIIRPSVSPYCARVVPVRKKNGGMRLCMDLRPLNSRVAKQKYPFPVIEECLSRLSNKTVFILLDLKDSFHQIRVHEESTKYFSFATPDGQYEYTRLPFGFCESPAEFQKRLVQILTPLIRDDQVLLYVDDVLIPSETVEQNLDTLKSVLILLKQYQFKLNYEKCLFLRKKVEFLGYIVSSEGVTLSNRHTEAIRLFPPPTNVPEVQRFLGLTGYFRRFIRNYSLIAKPLYSLLKKSAEFIWDPPRQEAFERLKQELTVAPVLSNYNPAAETELHTDASIQGLGAMLLQRQKDNKWAPIAYYSQSTNQAERNYHSFEL